MMEVKVPTLFGLGFRGTTVRITPAMETGVAEHVRSIEEILDLLTPKKETPNQFPG
jgi:hypothetical protein